jgi:hypothetical protein
VPYAMPTYTVTFFNQAGLPARTEDRVAADDDAILDQIGEHSHQLMIEVHHRDRLVGRCPAMNTSWRDL